MFWNKKRYGLLNETQAKGSLVEQSFRRIIDLQEQITAICNYLNIDVRKINRYVVKKIDKEERAEG